MTKPAHLEPTHTVISHRRAAAVLAVATASLVVAACGSSGGEDSKSADQILKDAQAALRSATSYHLKGDVDTGSGKLSLDVKVQGSEAAGHLDQQGGAAFDFVETGGKLYLRGQSLFAKYAPDLADSIGDKWIATSPDDPHYSDAVGSLSSFADPSGFADSLGSNVTNLSKGGTTSVDGRNAVVLKDSDGSLDIADGSPAYPLRLDAGAKGTVDISGYGSNMGISAPSASDTIDVGGGSGSQSSDTSTDTGSSSDTGTDSGTDTSSDSSSSS